MFTVLVSNYSIKEVDKLLHQIERMLSEQPFKSKDGFKLSISFSCSITHHLKDESLDENLKRDEKIFYLLKEKGRGCINSYGYSYKKIENGTTSPLNMTSE